MSQENMKSDKLLDAIGEIKDEMVEEALEGSGEPNKVYYNSWVKLAQNDERKQKMKKSKLNSRTTQSITVAIACVILFFTVALPWAQERFNFGKNAAETTESISTEEKEKDGSASVEPKAETTTAGEALGDVEESAEGAEPVEGASAETVEPEAKYNYDEADTEVPPEMEGAPFVLTGAEWRDNDNWPFFTNLVTSGLIGFPSYGLDPRNRIKVTLTDDSGTVLPGEEVVLRDKYDKIIWTSKTNKNGVAYLFYNEGAEPGYLTSNGVEQELETTAENGGDVQAPTQVVLLEDVEMKVSKTAASPVGTQIMFIVDTTGSMGDELAYLQKDFASIAEETFDGNTWFATAFYKDYEDPYVTKVNDFTQNLAMVQNQFAEEYANGGGDTPEAVSDILAETISNNGQWRDDCNKVVFMIFDAPPHDGTEVTVRGAIETAASKGIHIVPVVASNAERDTELFGRAVAILTDGTYVFLTDDSGVGDSHLEPIVGEYTVELLHDIIVRIINEYK